MSCVVAPSGAEEDGTRAVEALRTPADLDRTACTEVQPERWGAEPGGQPLGQTVFISATAALDCVFKPDRAVTILLIWAAEGGVLMLLAALFTSFSEFDSWLTR